MVTVSQYLLVTYQMVLHTLAMSGTDTPIVAARRKRLKAWIADRFGGKRKDYIDDAAVRGHKIDPTEVSNLQSGRKSFGEKKAAMLEEQSDMPAGYLVTPLAPANAGKPPKVPALAASRPEILNRDTLHESLNLLFYDEQHGGGYAPRAKADRLAELYARVMLDGGRLSAQHNRAFEDEVQIRAKGKKDGSREQPKRVAAKQR